DAQGSLHQGTGQGAQFAAGQFRRLSGPGRAGGTAGRHKSSRGNAALVVVGIATVRGIRGSRRGGRHFLYAPIRGLATRDWRASVRSDWINFVPIALANG